jgi:AmmeMemoRadiSam system protein A
MLAPDDRARLLRLARRCLEARVRGEPPPPVERGGGLDALMAAFVSIHTRGELRGCLGRLEIDRPIAETVAHLSAIVSDSDPRFRPLSVSELAVTDLEISALSPEEVLARPDEIELGRHGLIAAQGHRRGLLLPQVAIEHGWSRETFLEHTCIKAGLPPGAWRADATMFRFEAQVFREKEKVV